MSLELPIRSQTAGPRLVLGGPPTPSEPLARVRKATHKGTARGPHKEPSVTYSTPEVCNLFIRTSPFGDLADMRQITVVVDRLDADGITGRECGTTRDMHFPAWQIVGYAETPAVTA